MTGKTFYEEFDEWERSPKKPCPHCKASDMDAVPGRFDDQAHLTQVVCLACGTSGPLDELETMAWILWDGLPREAEKEADHVS